MCLSRHDETVFMAVPKPLLNEFGIHNRLESCANRYSNNGPNNNLGGCIGQGRVAGYKLDVGTKSKVCVIGISETS